MRSVRIVRDLGAESMPTPPLVVLTSTSSLDWLSWGATVSQNCLSWGGARAPPKGQFCDMAGAAVSRNCPYHLSSPNTYHTFLLATRQGAREAWAWNSPPDPLLFALCPEITLYFPTSKEFCPTPGLHPTPHPPTPTPLTLTPPSDGLGTLPESSWAVRGGLGGWRPGVGQGSSDIGKNCARWTCHGGAAHIVRCKRSPIQARCQPGCPSHYCRPVGDYFRELHYAISQVVVSRE